MTPIAGTTRRPQIFVRHVAELADAKFGRTARGVPFAEKGRRRVCYFGRCARFALFEWGERVALVRSPVSAAFWLSRA